MTKSTSVLQNSYHRPAVKDSTEIEMSDENTAPNQQPTYLHPGNGLHLDKSLIHKSSAIDMSDGLREKQIFDGSADPLLKKPRTVAAKRPALGDVSNVQTLNQISAIPGITRVLRSRVVVTNNSKESLPEASVANAVVANRCVAPPIVQNPPNPTPEVKDWDDLDADDAGDPSMCSEYVNDIFAYLYELERKQMATPDYMKDQNEITWKMRSVLIDWLVEVHWKLKLLPETLFLSVNLMDRFLSIRTVSLAKFQLVGITATLIASKFEEILSPSISNFVYLADGSYDEPEILKAECYMLNSLQFSISAPNPYVFLRRISKADNYDIQTRTLAKYFLEVSLLESSFLHFTPSQIATASIYLARKMLNRGEWNANLVHYSNYTSKELMPIVKEFISYLQKPMKHEAIFKKYASKKFMKASIFVKGYIEKYYPSENTAADTND